MRAPHRDVLACRGLAQRGKLRTGDRAVAFLARQGDNGIVWTVLSYWRATTKVRQMNYLGHDLGHDLDVVLLVPIR